MVLLQSVLINHVQFLLVFGPPFLANTCFPRPFPMLFLLLSILQPLPLNQGVVHKRMQPQTQRQMQLQLQPQIMQEELKTAKPPQAMKKPSILASIATTRVVKVKIATGKDGNSATQIGMQLKHPTIQSAITIKSVLKSIKKCTSKSDLHLLWINFHILFDYIRIVHNNLIDSPD